MIIRQKKQNRDSNTCSFYVEYGLPDIRQALKDYVMQQLNSIGAQINFMGFTYSEDDILVILAVKLWPTFPKRHQQKFAKWAFKLAVEQGFVTESAYKQGVYYMSAELARKEGRPTNEE